MHPRLPSGVGGWERPPAGGGGGDNGGWCGDAAAVGDCGGPVEKRPNPNTKLSFDGGEYLFVGLIGVLDFTKMA